MANDQNNMQAKRYPKFANFGEYLFWSYANLQMLCAALNMGKAKYDKSCYMIRAKAFKAYKEGRGIIHDHKKFLIIGNVNAINYREVFPYIMQNKIWLGPSIHSGDRKFWAPKNYKLNASGCGIDETGRKFIRVKGVRWFTNLDYKAYFP